MATCKKFLKRLYSTRKRAVFSLQSDHIKDTTERWNVLVLDVPISHSIHVKGILGKLAVHCVKLPKTHVSVWLRSTKRHKKNGKPSNVRNNRPPCSMCSGGRARRWLRRPARYFKLKGKKQAKRKKKGESYNKSFCRGKKANKHRPCTNTRGNEWQYLRGAANKASAGPLHVAVAKFHHKLSPLRRPSNMNTHT